MVKGTVCPQTSNQLKCSTFLAPLAVQQNKPRKSKTKAITLENEPKNKLSNPTGFHPSQLLLLR